MFKNYLTVAIRNLARHKTYTFINVIGLAIGLACSTLILLYLQHEFSFDRHHSKADRIYRVIAGERLSNGEISYRYGVQGPVASAMAEYFPEIEHGTRFYRRPSKYVDVLVEGKERLGVRAMLSDAEIFNIFDYSLVKGDIQTGVQTPFSVFITEAFAQKLFGSEDPIGKDMLIQSKWFNDTYTIAGVLKDNPTTSTWELAPDLITTTFPSHRPQTMESLQNDWGVYIAFTYILLKPNASIADLEAKLAAFAKRHLGEEMAQNVHYKVMPLTELHLYGHKYKVFGHGGITTCYTFGLIGILMLTVACINFMNLSTARSSRRMREVGMRKVVGAKRTQLIYQFLGESVLLSLLALILALGLTELTLPFFNEFMYLQLSLSASILPILFLLAIGVGLFAGSYPAFFLSAFRPVSVLKTASNNKGSHALVRKGLVVVQFAISMILIATTITVFNQTEYMRTADLGFKPDTLVEMHGLFGVKTKAEAMKSQYLKHAGVHQVTILHKFVGDENLADQFFVTAHGIDTPIRAHYIIVDPDFLNTYDIPLLSGRDFILQDFSQDNLNAHKILLNETAAKQFNVKVGDSIQFENKSREVVGIFRDIHNRSLHEAIRPLILLCGRNEEQIYMTLQINTQNLPDVMAHLETVWKTFHPDRASGFVFVDDAFDRRYQTEMKQSKLYAVCSGLAIAIACLGLLGLVAYTAEVRTKEIGVRKVLGATDVSIVSLLTKEFLVLVALASLLAWPIAYYALNDWLQNFAYRIELSLVYFIASTGVALVITLITIAYQALKAARANPIEALRYE
ncbi:MAG: FtsX-like permease family protein [Candidatus Latescibacteria bacterium]|nr:FtsX-like permease family protein [Candidatus Latescibacterota bacterium]